MVPTEGRMVILHLTEEQRKKLGGNHDTGEHSHTVAPAVIVKAWGNTETSVANLKVLGDSENNIWVTSAQQGTGPNQWEDPIAYSVRMEEERKASEIKK